MTRPGTAGRTGRATPFILTQLQASSQQTATDLLVTPEQFDATGTGKTVDGPAVQAAIDYCAGRGGGMVWLQRRYRLASKLIGRAGVTVYGQRAGRPTTGATGATLFASPGFTDDCVIEYESGAQDGALAGFNIAGLGGTSVPLAGVVVDSGTANISLTDMWVGNFSDAAVRLAGGVAHVLEGNILGYDVTGRTLTSRCGTLEVNGTDHWVWRNEISAGPASTTQSNGQLHVSYPATWYRTAVWVQGGTHHFSGNVAEFGDVDWYLDGCIQCEFEGDRADYSSAHGVVVDGAADNNFSGFRVFGNGAALLSGETPVSHGVIHRNGAKRNRWTGFRSWLGGARPQTVGYAWADYTTGNTAADENTLWQPSIDKREVLFDTVHRAAPVTSCWASGVGLTARPPSRHSQGLPWTNEDTWETRSNGTQWVDLVGDPVGNLAPPRAAEQIALDETASTVIAWEPFAGSPAKCAVSYGFWQQQTDRAKLLVAPTVVAVTVNAAGATAGYCEIGSIIALGITGLPAVIAGHTYTAGLEIVGESTSHAYTITLNARFWNEAETAFIDTGFTTPTAGGTTSLSAKVFAYLQGLTCPAGYTRLELAARIARTGLAAGEVIYVQHLLVGLGAQTVWSEP